MRTRPKYSMSKLSAHMGRYYFFFIVMTCYIGVMSTCKDYSIDKQTDDSEKKEACITAFISAQMSDACVPSGGATKTYGFACKQMKHSNREEPYTCEETEKYARMVNLCSTVDQTGMHVAGCIKELRSQFILPVLYRTTVECKEVKWGKMVSAYTDDANNHCNTNATP